MRVAFQRMLGILERWNNNQVTPSLRKLHELSYRSNNKIKVKAPIAGQYPIAGQSHAFFSKLEIYESQKKNWQNKLNLINRPQKNEVH